MYLHLQRLKARILPQEMVAATRFDERLTALGDEIAALFDTYTGRKLVREVGRVEDHEGGQGVIYLRAAPVETLTTLTIRYTDDDAFEALDYDRLTKAAGIIRFDDGSPGDDGSTIRATYTGGFWCDTSELTTGSLPSGATAMPADLLNAWVLQCDHEARVRKFFGTSSEDIAAPYGEALVLLPRVAQVLNLYRKLV